MSGGVGPSGDITLPQEQSSQPEITNPALKASPKHNNAPLFTFRQLNALAVIIVLSTSGMVAIQDISFVVFSLFYVCFMSKIAFPRPNNSPTTPSPPPIFDKNALLTMYIFTGTVVGLFAPIAYIFEGVFEGDKEGIKAAVPHVFLLASQIFLEGFAFSCKFSSPVRAFVPVFYNSRRIFTIMEWVRSEVAKVDEVDKGSERRLHIGRGLAFLNMAFWCFNLFVFLLPVYLPRALKIYYSSFISKVKD